MEFAAEGGTPRAVVRTGNRRDVSLICVPAPVLKHPAPGAWSNRAPLFNGRDISGYPSRKQFIAQPVDRPSSSKIDRLAASRISYFPAAGYREPGARK
jgi:hypothetical protein